MGALTILSGELDRKSGVGLPHSRPLRRGGYGSREGRGDGTRISPASDQPCSPPGMGQGRGRDRGASAAHDRRGIATQSVWYGRTIAESAGDAPTASRGSFPANPTPEPCSCRKPAATSPTSGSCSVDTASRIRNDRVSAHACIAGRTCRPRRGASSGAYGLGKFRGRRGPAHARRPGPRLRVS
jgi:hypothetical protein